jgi:hypothetical protein
MEDETFGEVEFEQKEAGSVFKTRDDGPYKALIERLIAAGPDIEAKVLVDTGVRRSTQVKTGKGRGVNELAESRLFQSAANEAGFGLRVAPRHQADGRTLLRMKIVPKRVFKPEQVQNRIKGQNERLEKNYMGKLKDAEMLLVEKPNDLEAKAVKADMEAKLAKVRTVLKSIANNGKTTKPKE